MRDWIGRALARPLGVAAILALGAARSTALSAQEIDCDRPTDREVWSLAFEGNTTFDDDVLSARVLTTPSSVWRKFFRFFGARRCLPDVGLEPDVRALEQFYQDNGFYKAQVDTLVKPAGNRRVGVTFRVAEGPPMTLDSLRVTGLDSVADRAGVLERLQLVPGRRVGTVMLVADVDSITSRLRNAGYPSAEVFRTFRTSADKLHGSADLDVVPGARARFGAIDVERAGASPRDPPEIDSSVVLGLLGFQTGNWYSDRALADAQRSLYNLGVYRHVGIEIDTTRQPADTIANIRVDLREDYMRQVTLEEGWATLDCFRIDGQYTDKNFFDKAWHLDLAGRVSKLGYGAPTSSRATRNLCYRPYLDQDSIGSSKLNYYAGATFRQPTLFSGHWQPAYSVYTERRSEYQAYLRTTYLGLDASASRDLGPQMPVRLGYTLEYGQTQADPVFLCALFSLCSDQSQTQIQGKLPFAVASASISTIRTDNLVDPTTGYRTNLEVRGSSPYIGSDQSLTFIKLTGEEALYRPITSRITFAARFRGGIIGGGRTEGFLPPPQERLYAGGAASVRGFQQNSLGPLVYLVDSSAFRIVPLTDSTKALVATDGATERRTIPVGGNRLLVVNLELRVRDPFFPNALQYVPFIDAGELASESGANVSNVNRLYVTPGLGVRYFSPVGPVQINVGYNPSKTRAGQAYWAPVRSVGKSPLICVTAPGAPVAPVLVDKNGLLINNLDSECPDSFVPNHGSNFFSKVAFSFSIGTSF